MFVGRELQMAELEALCDKHVASLVTCRGRRRVGKSTLVSQFAGRIKARFIRIEGIRPRKGLTDHDELAAFAEQLGVETRSRIPNPENWSEAFSMLDGKIRKNERTVVLLDEISWLGHYDPTFADKIKIAWDKQWKTHDKLIVVLCGSVSSWIKEKIVDNGAFMGRRSLDLIVRELPLDRCLAFWGKKAGRTATREIVDILSVMGGIPRYLEEINPSLSAAENIRRLCFSPNGVLRMDFDEMFNDVITEQPSFTGKVLRCLVDGPRTASELSAMLKIEKGGRVTDAIDRLVETGMVSFDEGRNPETGDAVKGKRYRLKDNYTRFYLKYIEPVKNLIDDGRYAFKSLEALEGWNSVMGLQFENLVVNNYGSLLPHLHLSDALLTSAAPYRKAAVPSRRQKGCQVDLLIQSKKTIYVVEVKRRREIERGIIDEVDAKVRCIKRPAGVSIRSALVYEGHLAPIVEADGYFDALVPIERLLGLPVG